MYKFSWEGNNGRSFPNPGEVAQVECGICGTQMNVKRNVNAPTGFAEAMASRAHLSDHFTCPHLYEVWHERVAKLVSNAQSECSRNYVRGDLETPKRIREDLELKVKKILEEAERQR